MILKSEEKMSIEKAIQRAALPLAQGVNVSDVRIGLGYTAVLLDDGHAGTAYTFRENRGGCSVYRNIRPLAGRPAADLLALFDVGGSIETTLALATANALFNRPDESHHQGDILAHLHIQPEDRVGMVGNFAPLIPAIRQQARELHVFEQIDQPQGHLLPTAMADQLLPQCQIALLTATAIINQTAEHLLSLAAACRKVVVLGASTPLCPDVFEGTGVTLLSGIVVKKPDALLQIVSEGGGMQFFKSSIAKVNRRL